MSLRFCRNDNTGECDASLGFNMVLMSCRTLRTLPIFVRGTTNMREISGPLSSFKSCLSTVPMIPRGIRINDTRQLFLECPT